MWLNVGRLNEGLAFTFATSIIALFSFIYGCVQYLTGSYIQPVQILCTGTDPSLAELHSFSFLTYFQATVTVLSVFASLSLFLEERKIQVNQEHVNVQLEMRQYAENDDFAGNPCQTMPTRKQAHAAIKYIKMYSMSSSLLILPLMNRTMFYKCYHSGTLNEFPCLMTVPVLYTGASFCLTIVLPAVITWNQRQARAYFSKRIRQDLRMLIMLQLRPELQNRVAVHE